MISSYERREQTLGSNLYVARQRASIDSIRVGCVYAFISFLQDRTCAHTIAQANCGDIRRRDSAENVVDSFGLVFIMAPKGRRSAKAKAIAKKVALKNSRRASRRDACQSLNALAIECHVSQWKMLSVKDATAADVEALVRLLEKRVTTAADMGRLRQYTQKYLDNGGVFSVPLLEEDALVPPAVPQHRLLMPSFELKSKAFMMTYNSISFARDTWQP